MNQTKRCASAAPGIHSDRICLDDGKARRAFVIKDIDMQPALQSRYALDSQGGGS
jgi:hypothetical protein